MPAIVTPSAILGFLTGGGGVGAGDVVGVVSVVVVSVVVVSVVVDGGGESAKAYAAASPATPSAIRSTSSAARFTARV